LKQLWYSMAILAALACCTPAAMAQTPASPRTTPPTQTAPSSSGTIGPVVNLWYAGLTTGVAGAAKSGGAFGGEAGVRTWRSLDVSLESGWFQNAVRSESLDSATTLANYLQASQGKPAGSNVKEPAAYLTINGRWVFESQRKWRPYGIVGVGGARVSHKSSFTLNGADISGSLNQYGVTLGNDLSGHTSHAAVTAGLGVLIPWNKWYVDVGYRLTSILVSGGAANVNRLNLGFGARF